MSRAPAASSWTGRVIRLARYKPIHVALTRIIREAIEIAPDERQERLARLKERVSALDVHRFHLAAHSFGCITAARFARCLRSRKNTTACVRR